MNDLEQTIRTLLAQHKKVSAVKAVCEATNWGLREAKDYVDAIEAGQSPPPLPQHQQPLTADPETLAFEVRELLAQGKKIQAIAQVRNLTGMDLREAKDFVDGLEKKH